MDIDTTLIGLHADEQTIMRIVESVASVDAGDGGRGAIPFLWCLHVDRFEGGMGDYGDVPLSTAIIMIAYFRNMAKIAGIRFCLM